MAQVIMTMEEFKQADNLKNKGRRSIRPQNK